jgi:hypothetical protein
MIIFQYYLSIFHLVPICRLFSSNTFRRKNDIRLDNWYFHPTFHKNIFQVAQSESKYKN